MVDQVRKAKARARMNGFYVPSTCVIALGNGYFELPAQETVPPVGGQSAFVQKSQLSLVHEEETIDGQ